MSGTTRRSFKRWGVSYVGRGSPEVALAALAAACSERGLLCAVTRIGDTVHVEGVQHRPWWDVVRRALPQRVSWRLERQGDRIELSGMFTPTAWYAVLTGLLALLSVLAIFAADLSPQDPTWLAYTAFGHPRAHCRPAPERQQPGDAGQTQPT